MIQLNQILKKVIQLICQKIIKEEKEHFQQVQVWIKLIFQTIALNNIQNDFKKEILKSNYKFHNNDNILFNQIFPNENNDEEMRKTKMRNVNGVDISSKLMDVLDIFKRVEKFQKANENLSLFEQLFSSK